MFVDACAAAVACCTSWKSLPMDALIESIDPRGRIIVLSVQQWVTHILPEHAELLGRETEIHVALKYPDIIASDIDHAARESYYRRGFVGGRRGILLLKVCVQFAPCDDEGIVRGTVITAYPTRRVKQGERAVWPSETFTI